jgi:exosortase
VSVAVTQTQNAGPEAASIRAQYSRPLAGLVAAALLLLYAPTIMWLFQRWTMGIWYNGHVLFIPPVVAYLCWFALRPLKGSPADASIWGFAFLVPALIAHALDTGIHSQILSAVALVVALPGLSLLFLGPVRTRAIAFPLAFSVFMLPIPLAITEHIHTVLREIGTAGAAMVLPLLRITVFSEGTTLHLSNATLFVGDGCSGFSTLYAAGAVAALSAFTCNYRRGRIQTLLAAAPIAIASNVLRIVLLAILIRWMGLGVLETWMHPASGLLTFAISLPLIFWLGAPRKEQAA